MVPGYCLQQGPSRLAEQGFHRGIVVPQEVAKASGAVVVAHSVPTLHPAPAVPQQPRSFWRLGLEAHVELSEVVQREQRCHGGPHCLRWQRKHPPNSTR